MQLFDLPLEILLAVLEKLTFTDIFACQRVGRKLRDIITDSASIQYTIQKDIAGVRDNPRCTLPIVDRLRMLRQIERSWACLEYDFKKKLDVPKLSSRTYDIASGVYLLDYFSDTDRFTTTGVQSMRLPSTTDESDLEWRTATVDRTILDFGTAIDEHDLLALITCADREGESSMNLVELVLLRHSTGHFHECADQPVIQVSSTALQAHPRVSIEIVGENLVIVVMYPQQRTPLHNFIKVYDWKRGVQKHESTQGDNIGIVFLREDIFISPNIFHCTLEVFRILSSSVQLIQVLHLPDLQPGKVIGSISCRAEPNPTKGGAFPTYASHQRPFSNRPEDAIIIIVLHVGDLGGLEVQSFSMIVHRKSLLAGIPDTTDSPIDRGIVWDAWGPPITRWFNVEPFSNPLITATSGQRYVRQVFPQEGGSSVVVLDFNQNRVRLAKARGLENERIVFMGGEEDKVCMTWGAFTEDISCHLPFLACQPTEEWSYDAISIDEQRIIGAHSGPDRLITSSLEVVYFG